MLNYIVKNYKWGPSWWRKDRKGNKKCLQGLKLKSLLMKVKGESEKAGIKLNIHKMKIMASGPITSWQINGATMGTVTNFIFLGSKITTDGEIKRRLLLGRKPMTNLDSIIKSRDITWLTKVHIVKAMVLPVVMYGCKDWITKKAECRRMNAFKLWCWKRLLRVLGLQVDQTSQS